METPRGSTPKNLVLLGIGHTNAHVVERWIKHPIPGYRLICLSAFPAATYSGMLPGVLGGQFEEHEMQIALEPLVRRAGGELLLNAVEDIDFVKRRLLFADRESLPFDLLSIGIGSTPAGAQQQDSPLLVPIKPMQTFIERLDTRLRAIEEVSIGQPAERAARVLIVGGGLAGIEIALCLEQRQQRDAASRNLSISIITGGPQIAEGLPPGAIRRLKKILEQRAVVVYSGSRIVAVDSNSATAQDGTVYPSDCVIWATGASPPPLLERLSAAKDAAGFLATLDTLQSKSNPRLFAVGDSGTVIDSPVPKAGVFAVRQSPILWHNLRAMAAGGPLKRFEPQREFLKLANTGDGKAMLVYRSWVMHATWCWILKAWIDKRFVRRFQFPPIQSAKADRAPIA